VGERAEEEWKSAGDATAAGREDNGLGAAGQGGRRTGSEEEAATAGRMEPFTQAMEGRAWVNWGWEEEEE